jgi:hypothetical protein
VQKLRPQVERQIEQGLRSLSQEFAEEVAPDAVWRAGRQRLREVMSHARFDDFLPVLVYRSVRERILYQLEDRREPVGSH